jgi:uncharacterized membrane protein YbaN (DUF454 family)
VAALTALGGTTAWVGAAKQIIAVYAEAFPTTPFFITAATPFDNADGLSALQQVVDWGVATYQQDADKPSNQTMLAIQGAALKGNLDPEAPKNLHIED